ncbi:MAG TPA: hypothetical protein VGL58_17285 [Caulobacteraceae bacterium]|jgi:hypothetical protein
MEFLKDRRFVLLAGGGVALLAGLGLAWLFLARSHPPTEAPPASQGGLVVESGRADDAKLDPQRPLRCFVGGQFVGELPLAVCAQRNGVATGALDVGLDQAGALAASNGAGANITPLPPLQPPLSQPLTEPAAPAAANDADQTATATPQPALAAACWRYGDGAWRQLPGQMTLSACVQDLYEGRCAGPGDVFYGRWSDQTVRQLGGRVEISADNVNFHSLIERWPACTAGVAPGFAPG